MHHKCEGKYLVPVSSGGGSVASAAPRSVVVQIRYRRAPSASRYVSVSLRQRLIQVPLLHAIYPVIEAHLGIYKGHGDDLLHGGNTLSAKVKILLGAPAFYII